MKKYLSILAAVLIACQLLCGCGERNYPLDPANPVNITMWHNWGGVMQETMDLLVDTFNSSVGRELGIIMTVTAVSSSSELTENLNMILDEDPAAMPMPNISVAYPKTAVLLAENGMLADLSFYFGEEKLNMYVGEFVNEGIIDGALYVFPVAKSTEVLYVNKTLFDRFSAECGVTLDSLSTFEGIFDASVKYYNWCGKAFFTADSWFNLFSAAGAQTGEPFCENGEINYENAAYKKLYALISDAVSGGGITIYSGYSSDLSKTGDIVCSLGSTAGILYYGDSVTYADNTTEAAEYTILPYPTVEGGERTAIQRGNGMVVKKASEAEEYACAVFLEWFTSPEQNMKFITNTGYLPVTKQAYGSIVSGSVPQVDNVNIEKLLSTAVEMQKNYRFYIPPVYEAFDSQSKAFETDFKTALTALMPEV